MLVWLTHGTDGPTATNAFRPTSLAEADEEGNKVTPARSERRRCGPRRHPHAGEVWSAQWS